MAPTEEKYIFDGRTPITLIEGVAVKVESDGQLTFLISNTTTTATLVTTTAPAWVSGAITEIVAEWRSGTNPLMRLSVDGTVVAEDLVTVLPTGLTDLTMSTIAFGSDANVAKQIDSEFLRTTWLKRPRS